MPKYTITVTGLLALAIIIIILILTCPRVEFLKKNEKVVKSEIYDSLVAIANRPPKIDTLVMRDTIRESVIKWRYKLVPVYLDSLSAVYSDTLKTNRFKVVVNDTLQFNKIVYRKYDYESYLDTIIIFKEKEKPVFVDRDVPVAKKGFYYGAYTSLYKEGFGIGADFTYISKKDFYYGISGGVINYYSTDMKYYPILSLRVGKKF